MQFYIILISVSEIIYNFWNKMDILSELGWLFWNSIDTFWNETEDVVVIISSYLAT